MRWMLKVLSIAFVIFVCGCMPRSAVELPDSKCRKSLSVDVVERETLSVSGVLSAPSMTNRNYRAAIFLARYYSKDGKEVSARGLTFSPMFKCGYKYLAAGPVSESFVVHLTVPDGAVRAEISVSKFFCKENVLLSRFKYGFEAPTDRSRWRMQIVSVWFLLFVAVVLLLYFCMPGMAKPSLLLLASVCFYSCFNKFAFFFIGGSALSIWLGGLLLGGRRPSVQKLVLALVLVLNIGILLVAKYLGWAVEGVCDWFDWSSPTFSIVLPLGISFYTLQAVSYAMDVYRGTIAPERNFFKLFLYLIFFPTVMQGPISRYGQLGPQLWTPHAFSWDRMQSGLELAVWGFFKKMVIADRVAMLVDTVFAPGATVEGFPVLLGVIGYSIQIYADFSGCVDICRGISEMLGIDLIQNFKHPYFAMSIKDFWRRWHISLSSWLKDYVYIPLGGNRHGTFRKYLNILIVFGVSGIWHGVGINFFIWGLLHGVYQIIDGLTARIREKALAFCHVDVGTFSFRLGQRIATFVLVSFAWVFFRAPTLADASSVLKRLCVFNPWTWTDGSYLKYGLDSKDLDVLLFSLVVLVVVSILQERGSVRQMLAKQTLWFRWTIYLLGVFSTLIFGIYGPGYNAAQFIYMGF